MRCSLDVRMRMVNVVRGGGSKAEAAQRFKVGEAGVDRWLAPGGLIPSDLGRTPPTHWMGP